MPQRKLITTVIPAKNNESTIFSLVQAVLKCSDRILVIIDSGTRDETASRASMAGAEVLESKRIGKGAAFRLGFETALSLGTAVLATIDADGQYDPKCLGLLLAEASSSRTILLNGSRLLGLQQDNTFPRIRLLGNVVVASAFTYAFGIEITDALSGLRVYSSDLIERLNVHSDGYGVDLELLAECILRGAPVVEKPIRVFFEPKHAWVARDALFEVSSTMARYLKRRKGPADPVSIFFTRVSHQAEMREDLLLRFPPILNQNGRLPDKVSYQYDKRRDSYSVVP